MQRAEQLVVPVPSVNVEEHGAGSIGLIGHVHLAFGQFPDQPGINRSKSQFAALGLFAGARHVVENPTHLGS